MWRLFRAQRKRPEPTVTRLLVGRHEFEILGLAAGDPPDCLIGTEELEDVRVEWLVPPGSSDEQVLLYLHGGAYAMGSPRVARNMLKALLEPTRLIGCSVDYRLAPEHPFPAGLDDAVAAYEWLLQTWAPEDIVVAGDSAGGGLAIAMLVAARDRGLPMPAAATVTSPWADMRMTAGSLESRRRRDPALEPEMLQVAAEAYLGNTPPGDPLASPVLADLTGLPPMQVLVGTEEILYDDALALVARARHHGVEVELLEGERMIHCWTGYTSMLQPARDAVASIGAFLDRHLGVGASA